MKKYIYLNMIAVLLAWDTMGQGNIRVAGGTALRIAPSTFVKNVSGLNIKPAASMTNSGTLSMKGDLTNDGTITAGTGQFVMNGTTLQHFGGASSTSFWQLTLANNVQLDVPASIGSSLNFQSGKLTLGSSDLSMGTGAIISGHDATRYIDAGGGGRLIRPVDANSTVFPVGTTAGYVPLTLSNAGTTDNFGIRVGSDVLENGTTGSTIAAIDHAVYLTWVLDEAVPGGSDLTATCQWNLSDEGTLFDHAHAGIGVYHSGAWDPQGAASSTGTGPYSLTRTGITKPGPLAVGDTESPLAVILALSFDLKEYLEGPFTGSEMTTLLNADGLIPLSQPFNGAPWGYSGTESVASVPNVNIVDWVLVELRDAPSAVQATLATRVARQAAFLLDNGQIVGLDGSSPLQFTVAPANGLYAVIWSRNHLAVMSASALGNSGGYYSYDFTTSGGQVYGGASGHKQVGPGTWGMAGGDGDASGLVDAADLGLWKGAAGQAGYLQADYNLDGQVSNPDKNAYWLPNSGKATAVP